MQGVCHEAVRTLQILAFAVEQLHLNSGTHVEIV